MICVLNERVEEEVTIRSGREFQELMTLVEKKNFLVLFLTRGTDKRREWPREDGLDVNEKKSSKQSDVKPCTILKTVVRSVMRR